MRHEQETDNHQKVDLARAVLGPAPAQMKEFDFLIGRWSATTKSYAVDGTIQAEHQGKLSARHLNGGRMILDDFTRLTPDGEEISYAATLRTFCEDTNHWEMAFMFSLRQEHTQYFRGQFTNGEGVFRALIRLTHETSIDARVRFFDIQQNSFEWSMEHSADGGKTWVLGERISAKRVA